MKKRFISLLLAASPWLTAQSVHLTVPAVDASGATVTNGTAYFTWQPFVDTNGNRVSGSQMTRPIVNGVLDVTLSASDNAGYVYTVLVMNGIKPSTFRWKVPAAGASSFSQLNQVLSAPPLNATAIQGNPFKPGTPSASQTYIWNATTGQFELGTVSGGGAIGALLATNNLADLSAPATARTNLGLGTAATQPVAAFDASGAATAAANAAVAAIPVSGSAQTNPALLSVADRAAFNAKQPALAYTAQNAATANVNNAGIGNCPAGQFATGTAAGSAQPCATPAGGSGGGAGSLLAVNNLSDVSAVATARTNLGLGTAATQPASAFDASGAASTAVAAIPVSGSTQTNPALLSVADRTAFAAKQTVLGFTPENAANKGAASGYAPLNAASTVPLTNLPTIPFSQLSGVQASLGYTAQNAAAANPNNAGIGNCPAGQFATGTAAGSTQPCSTPVAGSGAIKLPLNSNYATSTNNTVGGGAPFTWLFNQQSFSNTVDTQSAQGYNICANGTQCVPTEPALFWGLEDKYLVSGTNYQEAYLQYQPTTQGASRPIFIQINRDTNTLNDFELNSDVGIGFHSWVDNTQQWAILNPAGLNLLGTPTQTSDTSLLVRGQNGKFGALRLDNGSTGLNIASVNDIPTIWEFDLPGQNNWIKFNNTQTVFGGSDDFTGSTTTFESPAGSSRTAVTIKQAVNDPQPLLTFQNSSAVQGAAVFPSGSMQSFAYQGAGVSPALFFSTGAGSLGSGSTNSAGVITSTTTGAVSFTLTWASSFAYPHRAVCTFTDETTLTNTINTTQAAAPTATTLTASGSTNNGDVISYSCIGY